MIKLGVDFSEHGGDLSPLTVECWLNQGVEQAIVQYSARMRQHLDTLKPFSLVVEGYTYLYWGLSPWNQTPMQRVQNTLALANGDISFLWLDCEDRLQPFDPWQLSECVRLCEVAGVPCGIYSAAWWWIPYTGNTTAFSRLPLWAAQYLSESPTPDFSKQPASMDIFRPFGGWVKPDILQWHNTTNFCSHSVDLNVFEDVTPVPVPVPGFGPVWLNTSGSQRIESRGTQIVFFNDNVPVLIIGDDKGAFPGQIKKLFGSSYAWLRSSVDSGIAWWSSKQGD